MKKSRYIIGIDLGTTNSSVSYIDTTVGSAEKYQIKTFAIPQLTAEGTVRRLKTLPSFLYLPGKHELDPESIALPWQDDPPCIVGEFARIQGARVPSKLVSSVKSWLCHNRVDRNGPILPWGRESGAKGVSPVEASSYFIKHIKDAWNYTKARGKDNELLERQRVIITIPASFDEAARELTAEAVMMTGIDDFTMLEEPQAAFYSWIYFQKDKWTELVSREQLILVFDVGGGTTDFNLIQIIDEGGKMGFRRVAVGDHLMLGGDNMDLALARDVEVKILGKDKKLSFHQWLSLSQQCRAAKEELLSTLEKKSIPVSILGTGSSVIGGSLDGEITIDDAERNIREGFFRDVSLGEDLQAERRTGLQELGLPFVSDTSVMKHLSSFLKKHSVNRRLKQIVDDSIGQNVVRPDVLLFNGGVFKSKAIRKQAESVLKGWFSDGEWKLTILKKNKLDHAVSTGAAYYGLVLQGDGIRISGGSGKAYYIAVGSSTAEKDSGMKDAITAVCILPRGVEEGKELHLSSPEFEVMTNSPVTFGLYASSYRVDDKAGDIITDEKDSFIELPHIRTVLHFGKKKASQKIPVTLGIRLNEFGTLDVWCESRETTHRWKLAFQLREENGNTAASVQKGAGEHTVDDSTVEEAIALMERGMSSSLKAASDLNVRNIMKRLTGAMDLGKNHWPLFAIRKIWNSLIKLQDKRDVTASHEARWLNLSGFLLRPGFGYQLDEWRINQFWKIYAGGLRHPGDGQCRSEWWILWRRVAGGLNRMQQDLILRNILPWLLPAQKKKETRKLSSAELIEIWMLAASLEHIPQNRKTALGNELISLIKRGKIRPRSKFFWALSRVGARTPFYGPLDLVVSTDVIAEWVGALMEMKWPDPQSAVYAITQMTRKTGDRTRDIDDGLRRHITGRLSEYDWAKSYIRQINEVVTLEWKDEKGIFGESLPIGLYIE